MQLAGDDRDDRSQPLRRPLRQGDRPGRERQGLRQIGYHHQLGGQVLAQPAQEQDEIRLGRPGPGDRQDRNARLDNFARATVWTRGGRHTKRSPLTGQDKGQRAELATFLEAVRLGAVMPIGLDSLVATTRATIAVGESLVSGGPVTP